MTVKPPRLGWLGARVGAAAGPCWPRSAASATVAETSITTNPAMPSDGMLGDGTGHQDRDTEHEADPGDDRPATGGAAERRAAQRRGELGVLLDEGALHLLEQSELLFREWHRSSPTGHRRTDLLRRQQV